MRVWNGYHRQGAMPVRRTIKGMHTDRPSRVRWRVHSSGTAAAAARCAPRILTGRASLPLAAGSLVSEARSPVRTPSSPHQPGSSHTLNSQPQRCWHGLGGLNGVYLATAVDRSPQRPAAARRWRPGSFGRRASSGEGDSSGFRRHHALQRACPEPLSAAGRAAASAAPGGNSCGRLPCQQPGRTPLRPKRAWKLEPAPVDAQQRRWQP